MKSLRYLSLICCWFVTTGPLALAQSTNLPVFEWSIVPTNGSALVTGSSNDFFVTITNSFVNTNYTNGPLFTNITVSGAWAGTPAATPFLDDGNAPDTGADDAVFSASLAIPLVQSAGTNTLQLIMSGEVLPDDPQSQEPLATVTETNEVDYFIVVPPGNDHFTNAFKIPSPGGVTQSANSYASLEPGEPVHGGITGGDASVWWVWPSLTSSRILVDLAGTDFDAVLAIYTGRNVSNLTEVVSARGDAATGKDAAVTFDAQAGETYRIAVSSPVPEEMGEVRLRVEPGGVPDASGPVVSIASPPSDALVLQPDVFVSGTAKERNEKESGIYEVILQVNSDTNLVVANGTETWSGSVTVPPGWNLVKAYAVDYAGNRGPTAAVLVRYPDPINDEFAQALELDPVSGVEVLDTTYATREEGEPFHSGNAGGGSVWFQWRAPLTGDLYLTTDGSAFDTLLALYIGTTLDTLTEVASNDDAYPQSEYSELFARVIRGQLYYIAVDGLGGDFGEMIFSYGFSSTEELFSVNVQATAGGRAIPPSAAYPPGTVVSLHAYPDLAFDFVGWEDETGTIVSTDNPLAFVVQRNYSFAAHFQVREFTETFQTGGFATLNWSSQGDADWRVERVDGQFAAQSGGVNDGQSSSLVLRTPLYAGAVAFDVKVSSEEGWDWLEFYVNGELRERWSGEVPWTSVLTSVQEGPTTLEWRYAKDANFSEGLDTAFVDNIYVPVDPPRTPAEGAVLSLASVPGGAYQVTITGTPGARFIVETSPDLRAWEPAWTNQLETTSRQWLDPDSVTPRQRFYRVEMP